MKKFLIILWVGLFFPYLWIGAEEEKKGEVIISYIEGDVDVFLFGKKDWEGAKLNQKLREGDRIRTRLQSKAEIKLKDGSTINISENSIMDIKELFEKGLTKKSSFKLWMGGIKARFERLRTKDSEAKFYTPTAVMGLRGTTVWLLVDWEGKTRCGFEKGSGYIYSDKEGEKPVGEGEEAFVSLEGDITIKRLEMKTVPDVVGKSLTSAKADITGAGLKVGEVRSEESTEPPDTVLSQYPKAGEKLPANTPVSLVVASPIPPVLVPDLIGLSKEEAIARINEAGLVLGIVIEEASERPKDEVLKQRPMPGVEVKKGSPVDIAVSKGPSPKVLVPDLIGKTKEEAIVILEGVGLRLSGAILKKESVIISEGRIVEQKPRKGEEANLGGFVQIWIAIPPLVEKPPIPTIHYRFSIPGLFINEIPYLILNITPSDKKWAPLYLQVMERLTKFDNPPYILNFKPPVMAIGVNKISISCWFENGNKATEVIETPYYDPYSPKILSVKPIIGEKKIKVIVEDRESGIKSVRIGGADAGAPTDYTKEERAGMNVYTRGTYEGIIPIVSANRPTIPVIIEVEDNAGNKRERKEMIPEAAFSIPGTPKP